MTNAFQTGRSSATEPTRWRSWPSTWCRRRKGRTFARVSTSGSTEMAIGTTRSHSFRSRRSSARSMCPATTGHAFVQALLRKVTSTTFPRSVGERTRSPVQSRREKSGRLIPGRGLASPEACGAVIGERSEGEDRMSTPPRASARAAARRNRNLTQSPPLEGTVERKRDELERIKAPHRNDSEADPHEAARLLFVGACWRRLLRHPPASTRRAIAATGTTKTRPETQCPTCATTVMSAQATPPSPARHRHPPRPAAEPGSSGPHRGRWRAPALCQTPPRSKRKFGSRS
jgi:hypothetical protein